MAKQSNLEKIGIERRNEYELVRNDIKKSKPYDVDHDTAVWHEGDITKPLGKGTRSDGHQHSIPQAYNELTKNQIRPQLDTENGGGAYDINGRPGVGGGRKWLQIINLYDKDNQYGVNSIDTSANIEDGQIFIK
jgi:hypothetical protein